MTTTSTPPPQADRQARVTLTPSYDAEAGTITIASAYSAGLVHETWAEVVRLRDAAVRALLMGLGWTPPARKNDISPGRMLRLADGRLHPADAMALSKKAHEIQMRAAELVHDAAEAGFIVTIEREPLQPLAQGNHQAMIEVYQARQVSETTSRDAMRIAWNNELWRRDDECHRAGGVKA